MYTTQHRLNYVINIIHTPKLKIYMSQLQPTSQFQMNTNKNIRTLDSYIDEEPNDYVNEQQTQKQNAINQYINQLKFQPQIQDNLLNPDYLQNSNINQSVPPDCDFEQFDNNLQNSIKELNEQVVGADRYKPLQLKVKQPNLPPTVQRALAKQQQQAGTPQNAQKTHTLDQILQESISKIQNQSVYDDQQEYADNTEMQQNQISKAHHQSKIPQIDDQYSNEQLDEYEQKEQQINSEEMDKQYRNPRSNGLQATQQKYNSFQHVCHKIDSMRNNSLEQKQLDMINNSKQYSQRQSDSYRQQSIDPYQTNRVTNLNAVRAQVNANSKKSEQWLERNFRINLTPCQYQTPVFQHQCKSQYRPQSTTSRCSSQQISQPQKQFQQQYQQRNIVQTQNKQNSTPVTRSSYRQNNITPYDQQKSSVQIKQQKYIQQQQQQTQYTQSQQQIENDLQQIDQQLNTKKVIEKSNSQKSSRRNSFSEDQLATPLQGKNTNSIQPKYNQFNQTSIQQGMKNNILNKQLQIQQPKQSDSIYYRQMLQRQLVEQKLQQERERQEQLNLQHNSHSFTPKINPRPAYLDSIQRTPKADSFFREDPERVSVNIEQYNQHLVKSKPTNVKQDQQVQKQQQQQSYKFNLSEYVKQKQVAKQVSYKNNQNVQQPTKRQSVQIVESQYTPRITQYDNNTMSKNLKQYLNQPVYDRLQQKYQNKSNSVSQVAQQQHVKQKSPDVDFSAFLKRQSQLQEKKILKIQEQQFIKEVETNQLAEKPKINKQSEMYLKYRNLLNINNKNKTDIKKQNSYQEQIIDNNYARGAVKQFSGQIW